MLGRARLPLVCCVLLLVSLFPAVAYATPGTAATAYTEVREVTAGTQQVFLFYVTNQGATTINYVRIAPDTPDVDPDPAVTLAPFKIVNGAAYGWTFTASPDATQAVFTGRELTDPLNDFGAIRPGETVGFGVVARAGRVKLDETINWQIDVASDRTGTELTAIPETPQLSTALRVLKVQRVWIAGPEGALDYEPTAGQTIDVRMAVANYSPNALDVAPSPTLGTSDLVSAPPAPQRIPGYPVGDGGAGPSTATFEYSVQLGSSGTRYLIGDASADGDGDGQADADAVSAWSDYVLRVVPLPAFSLANWLSPTAFARGTTQTFAPTFWKTQGADAALDPTNTRLVFTNQSDATKTFSAHLAERLTFAHNGFPLTTVRYTPVTIPDDIPDGTYSVRGQFAGTDDNGIHFNVTTTISTTVTVDSLAPIVAPTLAGPGTSGRSGMSAAKDSDTLTFGGTIKRTPGGANDGSATVINCELIVFEDSGGAPGVERSRTNVELTACRNAATFGTNAGTITGSKQLAPTGLEAGYARLDVQARDAAGNVNQPAPSNLVEIDNVAPKLDRARTGCAGVSDPCEPGRTIRVFFTEPVRGEFLPGDFSAGAAIPVRVQSTCTATTFCNNVVLTLADGFGSDGTPQVSVGSLSASGTPARTPPRDGVGFTLAASSVTAADGIHPPLPKLEEVSQIAIDDSGQFVDEYKPATGGRFYTNDVVPTFKISGVQPGYQVFVLIDSNGDGDWSGGLEDQLVASCVAESATATCTATSQEAGAPITELPDGEIDILVAARDQAGNLSSSGTTAPKNASLAFVTVDRAIAPIAVGNMVVDPVLGKSVTVTFGETIVSGRNAAADWRPFVIVNGRQKYLRDASVSGSGAARSIKFDPTESASTVDGVMYVFEGTPSTRYRDIAGNYVGNFSIVRS